MRKIIDEKGRLWGKISIIDLFVLIVVIVLIAAVYIRSNISDKNMKETVDFVYQLELKDVRDYTFSNLNVGDTVYDAKDTVVGTIKQIDVRDATAPSSLMDGTYVIASIENKHDVIISIEAKGTIDNAGRYFITPTFELNINASRGLYTKYRAFQGTIVGIE